MKKQSGLQMIQNLNNFLKNAVDKQFATKYGIKMHMLLQNVVIDDVAGNTGDIDVVSVIKNRPDLIPFFCANAKTEVAIAGYVEGYFISRRIDRLVIDNNQKTVLFMDYKTDSNTTEFYDKYKKQLFEYAELLRSVYPDYKINGFILWVHNWQLDKVIC